MAYYQRLICYGNLTPKPGDIGSPINGNGRQQPIGQTPPPKEQSK